MIPVWVSLEGERVPQSGKAVSFVCRNKLVMHSNVVATHAPEQGAFIRLDGKTMTSLAWDTCKSVILLLFCIWDRFPGHIDLGLEMSAVCSDALQLLISHVPLDFLQAVISCSINPS